VHKCLEVKQYLVKAKATGEGDEILLALAAQSRAQPLEPASLHRDVGFATHKSMCWDRLLYARV